MAHAVRTALAARYGRTIRRMQADALVPVPVHATRKKTRGFNQAEILARVIGKKLGIPVIPEMLVRNKKTLPQKDLSAAERLKNLSGAFAAGEIPEGIRSVILMERSNLKKNLKVSKSSLTCMKENFGWRSC